MDKSIIAKIQSFGFDVYMRDPDNTFLYFTDGTNIGYLQDSSWDGLSLSTVHAPNQTTGTGFQVEGHTDKLTKEALMDAFALAPGWASGSQRASVKKYPNMEAFLRSSSFHGEYKLVPKIHTD